MIAGGIVVISVNTMTIIVAITVKVCLSTYDHKYCWIQELQSNIPVCTRTHDIHTQHNELHHINIKKTYHTATLCISVWQIFTNAAASGNHSYTCNTLNVGIVIYLVSGTKEAATL